jgi:hypothetical protein
VRRRVNVGDESRDLIARVITQCFVARGANSGADHHGDHEECHHGQDDDSRQNPQEPSPPVRASRRCVLRFRHAEMCGEQLG